MAKIVESTGDDAKAKARHAKIANEKKEAEERARAKISDDKWKARRAEERRKEIRHRKDVEKEQKRQLKEADRAKKEAARKEAEAKAAGAVAHEKQEVEEAIQQSERSVTAEAVRTEEIAEQVQETVAPTEHEEGVPGEIPAENVESPEEPEKAPEKKD